jgi:hypothetical protein
MNVVRDAWTPTSQGVTSVSSFTMPMWSSGRPSSSAAICARTVSDPWPISEDPVRTVTCAKSSIFRIVPQPSLR